MIKVIFKYSQIRWLMDLTSGTIAIIDKVIMLSIGGFLVYRASISIGTYLALIAYEVMFKDNFFKIINFNIDSHSVLVSMSRIEGILALPSEKSIGKKLEIIKGNLEFRNIDFAYPDGKQILESFNLKIKAGEKVAIVGESGSGKSTIVNLLMGLYYPDNGQVLVDGIPFEKLDINYYRKKLGIVAQDNFFFKDTIKNNLLLGRKTSDKEIENALRCCCIDDFINDCDKGLDTFIETNGSNLSGGQRQRLSIARMLLTKPDIIILDEATSALDNITEAIIQQNLERELQNKTVITIAHRLSTIEKCDRIIVLQDGKILEEGTHQELLNSNGYYSDLVNRKRTGAVA